MRVERLKGNDNHDYENIALFFTFNFFVSSTLATKIDDISIKSLNYMVLKNNYAKF